LSGDDFSFPGIAEHEEVARKWVEVQSVFHQHGKTINGLAHISASQSHENPGVGGHMDHGSLKVEMSRFKVTGSKPLSVSIRYR